MAGLKRDRGIERERNQAVPPETVQQAFGGDRIDMGTTLDRARRELNNHRERLSDELEQVDHAINLMDNDQRVRELNELMRRLGH